MADDFDTDPELSATVGMLPPSLAEIRRFRRGPPIVVPPELEPEDSQTMGLPAVSDPREAATRHLPRVQLPQGSMSPPPDDPTLPPLGLPSPRELSRSSSSVPDDLTLPPGVLGMPCGVGGKMPTGAVKQSPDRYELRGPPAESPPTRLLPTRPPPRRRSRVWPALLGLLLTGAAMFAVAYLMRTRPLVLRVDADPRATDGRGLLLSTHLLSELAERGRFLDARGVERRFRLGAGAFELETVGVLTGPGGRFEVRLEPGEGLLSGCRTVEASWARSGEAARITGFLARCAKAGGE